jgi:hypothetical protein
VYILRDIMALSRKHCCQHNKEFSVFLSYMCHGKQYKITWSVNIEAQQWIPRIVDEVQNIASSVHSSACTSSAILTASPYVVKNVNILELYMPHKICGPWS